MRYCLMLFDKTNISRMGARFCLQILWIDRSPLYILRKLLILPDRQGGQGLIRGYRPGAPLTDWTGHIPDTLLARNGMP